jgi:hypothetical protein
MQLCDPKKGNIHCDEENTAYSESKFQVSGTLEKYAKI